MSCIWNSSGKKSGIKTYFEFKLSNNCRFLIAIMIEFSFSTSITFNSRPYRKTHQIPQSLHNTAIKRRTHPDYGLTHTPNSLSEKKTKTHVYNERSNRPFHNLESATFPSSEKYGYSRGGECSLRIPARRRYINR